jgi:hypothetical protein
MTFKVDKREEGLRELARMIAAAYRRRMSGATVAEGSIKNNEEDCGDEDELEVFVQWHDPECGGAYTETVKVVDLLRMKCNTKRKFKTHDQSAK